MGQRFAVAKTHAVTGAAAVKVAGVEVDFSGDRVGILGGHDLDVIHAGEHRVATVPQPGLV